MPLLIIPYQDFFNFEGSAQYQQAISTLSQKISLIEQTLAKNGITVETAETAVMQMLDDVFAGEITDDESYQDPDFISMIDGVFEGNDTDMPDNLTPDDTELFAEFDSILNS